MKSLQLLGIVFGLIVIGTALSFFMHLVQIATTLAMPFLVDASLLAFCIGIVLIPLSFIQATQIFSIFGYWTLAWIFGLTMWCFSFLLVFSFWGFTGVLIGCLLLGIGIIPLGFIATALHGQWHAFLEIGLLLILTYASHFVSSTIITSKYEA